MVKCLPEFVYFYCVLENKNIISKIRRSKVTDYAALSLLYQTRRRNPLVYKGIKPFFPLGAQTAVCSMVVVVF